MKLNYLYESQTQPEQWEFWLCRRDFKDTGGYETKPLLVVGRYGGSKILTAYTSTKDRSWPGKVPFDPGGPEGFNLPTFLYLGKMRPTPKEYFIKRVGALTPEDTSMIEDEIKRLQKNGQITMESILRALKIIFG